MTTLLALSLLGCRMLPSKDADGDGATTATDCNDSDPAINPGATEICDGVDNNCDSVIDTDATDIKTFYPDADADGFGSSAYPTVSCNQPSGYVTDSTDCADNNPAINPGAIEICDGLDNDCNSTVDDNPLDPTTWYADTDGDGYGNPTGKTSVTCTQPSGFVADNTDCNDSSSAAYPGATEVCDDIDNDCDSNIDGDATNPTTFYIDVDGDGYGGGSYIVAACASPNGTFVTDSTDCDDTDDTVHPTGTEVCDGADNDCNGTADDNPTDPATFFIDSDGDGFGSAATSTTGCIAPSGYVDDDTDCNDSSKSSYPGGSETCDGLDNDCDGVVDDHASDAATYYIDIDGDTFGAASFSTTACSQPSGYVSDSTDCNDVNATNYPGAVEICKDTVVNDCNMTEMEALGDCRAAWPTGLSTATAIVNGSASGTSTGADVAGLGDINGDGYGDYLVGAPGTSSSAGAAYVVYGSVSGAGASGTTTVASATYVATGISASDAAGSAVSAAGDVNGDGYADLLIGAPGTTSSTGSAYLLLGAVSATSTSLSAATATFNGNSTGDLAGASLSAAGDVNGDGFADMIFGAPGASSAAGAAYLIHGNIRGTLTFSASDAIFNGAASGDAAGSAVAGAGDFNGDGLDDVLIGASGVSSSTGSAYLAFGGVTGTVSLSTTDVRFSGVTAGDKVGGALSAAGDFDADGYGDVLIGAPGYSAGAGAAYLYLGGTSSGAVSLAASAITFTGASGEAAGTSVAGVGDIDGDGADDIAIGAPGATSSTGAVYLYLGGGSATGSVALSTAYAAIPGASTGEAAGTALAAGGDINGDGIEDVLVGAPSSTNGAAYLLAPVSAY